MGGYTWGQTDSNTSITLPEYYSKITVLDIERHLVEKQLRNTRKNHKMLHCVYSVFMRTSSYNYT
jgi:hypothetical protein